MKVIGNVLEEANAAVGHMQSISWSWKLWNTPDLNLHYYLKTYPIILSSLLEEILIYWENTEYM